MKRCRDCNTEKLLGEFYRTASGTFSYCKPCACERSRRWRQENPDKHRAAKRRWEAANQDRHREQKNRTKRKARSLGKTWARDEVVNPEATKARIARFHERHPEYRAQRQRQSRRDHPEREREYQRRYHEAHPDTRRNLKARRRVREAAQFVEPVSELLALELHDGVCGICGEDVDPFAFELDHAVPLACGGLHNQENVQPAHASCNRAKGARMEAAA